MFRAGNAAGVQQTCNHRLSFLLAVRAPNHQEINLEGCLAWPQGRGSTLASAKRCSSKAPVVGSFECWQPVYINYNTISAPGLLSGRQKLSQPNASLPFCLKDQQSRERSTRRGRWRKFQSGQCRRINHKNGAGGLRRRWVSSIKLKRFFTVSGTRRKIERSQDRARR